MAAAEGQDTVYRRIKEIKADMNSVLESVSDNFLSDCLEFIIKDNNMVAIPANRATYMEKYFVNEV